MKFKELFSTPKKAIISSICAIGVIGIAGTGTWFATEAVAEDNAIGAQRAELCALADAGIDPQAATIASTTFEREGFMDFAYEVVFVSDGVEYEYMVESETGAIISKEERYVGNSRGPSQDGAELIDEDEAKTIALDDAGLKESDVTFTKVMLDSEVDEDDVVHYDIEFYTADKEYDYEIDAKTGKVVDRDVDNRENNDNSSNNGSNNDENSYIGVSKAKEIALEDAGVSSSNATFTKAKLDNDDGVAHYDVKFYTSSKEYEYEINAKTGKIIDKEIDNRDSDDNGSNDSESSYIGVSKAKEIALKDAGVSSSNATFTKAKLDNDDGVAYYDVEFYTSSKEYDYEINAKTGNIMEKSVEGRPGSGNSNNGESSYIGTSKAKEIALKDAGVSSSNATFTKAKLDNDDGVAYYDIEFYTSSKEYDYEINAKTGNIMEKSVEGRPDSGNSNNGESSYIGTSKAKEIALKDAGVSSSNATFTKAKLDYDDGVAYYDIEFYTSSKEYDYEINAKTGKIMEREIDNRDDDDDDSNNGESSYIGTSKAKEIALKDAGVSSSNATFTKAKLDYDDGVAYYDIEFYTSSKEYDYEINAKTGKIMERDVEGRPNNGGSQGSYIGIDKAKKIALDHAGLKESEVTFKKAKLEDDDGRVVYEIEFYKGGVEYEYTIDATTGKILEWDSEVDD